LKIEKKIIRERLSDLQQLCCNFFCGIIILFLFSASTSHAQTKYWIEFTDKGILPQEFKLGNTLFDKTLKEFSPKAIKRRAEALGETKIEKIVTIEDAPVNQQYLDLLRSYKIYPVSISSWQNAISSYLTGSQLVFLKMQPFVSHVTVLPSTKQNTEDIEECSLFTLLPSQNNNEPDVLPIPAGYDSIIYHYGYTSDQLHRINVPPLHAMGFDGSGVILGFLDVGFNWRVMKTTLMHHVIGEFDFIENDSVTAYDTNDAPGQDGHGSLVLSAATGFLPDSIIGPAYNVDLILAKTEDIRTETPIKEDHYAAAMEWMEKLGVDVTSSSLGYFRFDSGYVSHTYADMNGKTTVSARACERAANLGVLVCTAMGNGGGNSTYPYMLTPADADSILSVGALDGTDSIAGFSSRGPTFDKRLKPEICAPGVNVDTWSRDNTHGRATGTSLATPLTSGSCALIIQAHPEVTAQAIRKAIMKTGVRQPGQAPDTAYGYGRLNAYEAALSLGTIIGPIRMWRTSDSIHHIGIGIAANNGLKAPRINYSYGKFNTVLPLTLAADSLIYAATFPTLPKGTHIRYYVQTLDGADTSTFSPRNAPDSTYNFYIGDTLIPAIVGVSYSTNELLVLPNPAHDVITVSLQTDESIRYVITDAIGRELLQYEAAPNVHEVRIRVDRFPAGVYELHVQSRSGKYYSAKFIIVR
jgi:subtilisin family serine protease